VRGRGGRGGQRGEERRGKRVSEREREREAEQGMEGLAAWLRAGQLVPQQCSGGSGARTLVGHHPGVLLSALHGALYLLILASAWRGAGGQEVSRESGAEGVRRWEGRRLLAGRREASAGWGRELSTHCCRPQTWWEGWEVVESGVEVAEAKARAVRTTLFLHAALSDR
jgi:hypothetical protein